MASRREYMRVTCESLCILNHNDNNYPVLLENFSMGGALLKVGTLPPDRLPVGTTVDLTLFKNSENPMKCSGKVIWINSSAIGVQF